MWIPLYVLYPIVLLAGIVTGIVIGMIIRAIFNSRG